MQTATPVPALVPPETRRLAYLPNWALRAVFLLGVMVALASQATAAPVVFEVSAQSSELWAVSGTVTIDTATGKVLSADLTAEDGSSTVIFDTVYYGTVTQITARPGYPVWTRMWFDRRISRARPLCFVAHGSRGDVGGIQGIIARPGYRSPRGLHLVHRDRR